MTCVLLKTVILSLYQIKVPEYGIHIDSFHFAQMLSHFDMDEPNQKASISKVHFMLPPMTQIHPPSRSSKCITQQVRAEKQC